MADEDLESLSCYQHQPAKDPADYCEFIDLAGATVKFDLTVPINEQFEWEHRWKAEYGKAQTVHLAQALASTRRRPCIESWTIARY